VKNQHGVAYMTVRVALWLADGSVVKPEFGESLACAKLEVVRDVIALLNGKIGFGLLSVG